MEEKKQNNEVVAENAITDDTEIDVGMIEESILFDKELHKEQHVWLLKGSIWKTYSFSKILDLIKRLQNGIKEYETLFDISNERKYRKMFNEEWKKEYQQELDKQGEGVIAGFPDFDLVYKLYFDQKAEIERLANVNMQTIGKNAELLLQVDELKEENAQLSEMADYDKGHKEGYEHGAKMTAKEILTDAMKWVKEHYKDTVTDSFGERPMLFMEAFGCLLAYLKDKHGVEVE